MRNHSIFTILSILFAFTASVQSQDTTQLAVIKIQNPSFEDRPHAGRKGGGLFTPGWYDCGAATETAPDIQPGMFNVRGLAIDGQTYLGLVVREDGTTESAAQHLSEPLLPGKCYEWSMYLHYSRDMGSPTAKNPSRDVKFDYPGLLRIWGGTSFCDRAELLYTTPVLDNTEWLLFTLKLSPQKESYDYIIIESGFNTLSSVFYNGNVLVDLLSDIRQLEDCGE